MRSRIVSKSAPVVPLLLALSSLSCQPGPADELTGFAAASLIDPLEEIARRFEESEGVSVRIDFASSGILGKKIEAGAQGDFFVAAADAPMDRLEERGLLRPGSRMELLGNRLVFVVHAVDPEESAAEPKDLDRTVAEEIEAILTRPGPDRIAIGDPGHVPAGIYARDALVELGLWSQLTAKVVPCADARAALVMVEAGHVDGGIVYATDARLSSRVRIRFALPASERVRIVYPAAVLSNAGLPELAGRFLSFLRAGESREVFLRYGFLPL